MKNEIRGLHSGEYMNEDGSSVLRVFRDDYGVRIEFVDYEFDIFQSWTVSDGEIVDFEWGSVISAQQDDMKKLEE